MFNVLFYVSMHKVNYVLSLMICSMLHQILNVHHRVNEKWSVFDDLVAAVLHSFTLFHNIYWYHYILQCLYYRSYMYLLYYSSNSKSCIIKKQLLLNQTLTLNIRITELLRTCFNNYTITKAL